MVQFQLGYLPGQCFRPKSFQVVTAQLYMSCSEEEEGVCLNKCTPPLPGVSVAQLWMFRNVFAAARGEDDKWEHQQRQGYFWLSCSNPMHTLVTFSAMFSSPGTARARNWGSQRSSNDFLVLRVGLCLCLWTQMMAALCLSSAWSLRLLEKENEGLAQQPVKPAPAHLRKPRQGKCCHLPFLHHWQLLRLMWRQIWLSGWQYLLIISVGLYSWQRRVCLLMQLGEGTCSSYLMFSSKKQLF